MRRNNSRQSVRIRLLLDVDGIILVVLMGLLVFFPGGSMACRCTGSA